MSGSERRRELRRRRHRKKQLAKLGERSKKAGDNEKEVIAHKIRNLTIGADELIERFKLQKK